LGVFRLSAKVAVSSDRLICGWPVAGFRAPAGPGKGAVSQDCDMVSYSTNRAMTSLEAERELC
jgi:hypothetical protein